MSILSMATYAESRWKTRETIVIRNACPPWALWLPLKKGTSARPAGSFRSQFTLLHRGAEERSVRLWDKKAGATPGSSFEV